MKVPSSGGGFHAIKYTITIARRVGWYRLWQSMKTRNACKTCALGMGGQAGGMRNELGHWPEVCKKSLQAMAADMQGSITPAFFERYSIAKLKQMSPRELEHCGRLSFPVIAKKGDTHYRPIDWEQAIHKIATRLKEAQPQRSFFYFSGRSSNEAGFLLQIFARAYGTNHVNNCSFYCHQASGVGLGGSIGSGTATVDLADVENSDLFFLIGGNPASNHPRLMSTLKRLRRKGGRVIVINPVKEAGLVNFKVPSDPFSLLLGSKIASEYVMPKIGSDMALFIGIAKGLFELGSIDKEFIESATEGFSSYKALVDSTEWADISARTGIAKNEIINLSEIYSKAQNVVFSWTMGITHHLHGVDNVQSIANLALLRGMVGRPNAGLLPLRGHSNVQGMGTMGVTPALKKEVIARLAEFGFKTPEHKGYDTMACMEAANRGEMDVALCLGGNLFGSNPEMKFAESAMTKISTIAYLSTTLNTGHAHGLGGETIILPVLARDEEQQATTQESMFNFVRLSDGGKARIEGPRSEVSVVSDIAAQVGRGAELFKWSELKNHDAIRHLIARIIPGMDGIKDIANSKKEFAIPGRIIHQPIFSTPTGKAQFFAHPLPTDKPLGKSELILMTVRSEGQFNTVVYEEEDRYRGQERRDIILISEADCKRLGLNKDDLVEVVSEVGRMGNILVRPYPIASGGALMYYPEANVLVPKAVDPKSKTPSYKAVRVQIQRSQITL